YALCRSLPESLVLFKVACYGLVQVCKHAPEESDSGHSKMIQGTGQWPWCCTKRNLTCKSRH
ncbi:hypothetical protein KSS87_002630, partial [Heliosperma pusillum]